MGKWVSVRRSWRFIIILICAGGLLYCTTTDQPAIQALRNILLYRVTTWWETQIGLPELAGQGTLRGCIYNTDGQPINAATVLVAERDGVVHTATSAADGCYAIRGIPAGRYVPVAGAPGYVDAAVRRWGFPLIIQAGEQQQAAITLPSVTRHVQPATDLHIGTAVTRTWALPHPGTVTRRELTHHNNSSPDQKTFLYLPITTTQRLPVLLTVYPGPVESWEGVSIPLAAAGYAVIALGPEYALDLEADIIHLQQLLMVARHRQLPGVDGNRIVVLGGSYSGLHVFRLLNREDDLQGAVLLGPPTDLFDLRRRFEEGRFSPPFGLDQALIALGRPNTSPAPYWHNSARYHVQADWPPLLLMHSRDDEVVPFQQTELLMTELDQGGVPYEAHIFEGMSHYLRANEPSEDLDRLYAITTDFLARVTEEASTQ
jgi:dipeptidyl aminopeptidase/acylaminoacyl peptidase